MGEYTYLIVVTVFLLILGVPSLIIAYRQHKKKGGER